MRQCLFSIALVLTMGLCAPIYAGVNAEMTLAGKYFRNSILNSVNEFAQIFLAQKQK
jgi:hypothetical protein